MTNDAHHHNMQGIALILMGALLLSVMDGVVKILLESGFSVLQILAVRSWFIAPVMAIWVWRMLPGGALHTPQPGMHFVRGVLGFFAPLLFFKALQMMALADTTVIFFRHDLFDNGIVRAVAERACGAASLGCRHRRVCWRCHCRQSRRRLFPGWGRIRFAHQFRVRTYSFDVFGL